MLDKCEVGSKHRSSVLVAFELLIGPYTKGL